MTRLMIVRIDGEWQIRAFGDPDKAKEWVLEMQALGFDMIIDVAPIGTVALKGTQDEAALRLMEEMNECGDMHTGDEILKAAKEGAELVESLRREVNDIINKVSAGPNNRNLN